MESLKRLKDFASFMRDFPLDDVMGPSTTRAIGGVLAVIACEIEQEIGQAADTARAGGCMTGLERLRELASWADENLQCVWHGSETLPEELRRIATEMEGEQEALVAETEDISGRDADALAWIEKHGGLDEVVARWAGRVPAEHVRRMAERWKDRRERIAAHARRLEGLLGERRREIARLHAEMAAMRPRLMPDGLSWPRFKDDAPVRFGDEFEFEGERDIVESVTFHSAGSFVFNRGLQDSDGRIHGLYCRGERVKRPAPEVLDADGVEIRVGDTVYLTDEHIDMCGNGTRQTENECGLAGIYPNEPLEVDHIGRDGDTAHFTRCGAWCPVSWLTHRAPVLAADGKPLREGETVWDVKGNRRFKVVGFEPCPKHAEYAVKTVGIDGLALSGWSKPSDLTHKRHDSWERLESDVGKSFVEYWGCRGVGCDECPSKVGGASPRDRYRCSCGEAMHADMIRRARALAERGR